MKITPIQESFASGEVSPFLHNRINSRFKQTGLDTLLNMFPLSHGPVISRGGSVHSSISKQTVKIRLIPFKTTDANFILELGESYIRIHNEEGRVDGGGLNIIDDNAFHDLFTGPWVDKSTGPGGVVTGLGDLDTVELDNQSGSHIAALNQQVTVTIDPFTISGLMAGDGDLRIMVGNSDGGTSELDETISTPGDWSFSFTPGATGLWIEFQNTGANGTKAFCTLPIFSKDGSSVELVTPFLEKDLNGIHFESIIGNDELIFVHNKYSQYQITYTGGVFSFTPITFTSPPASWAGIEYPDSVTYHQGRVYYTRKRNLWGSRIGNNTNFDLGVAGPGDAIAYSLAIPGNIKWIQSSKELLLGSETHSYRVIAFGGVIIPGDIDIRKQSRFGSNGIQPIDLGDQVAYVSPNNRKVRVATYSEEDGWQAPELTWQAEHITHGRIKEIHYAPDPFDLVMCILEDGTSISCTYRRDPDPDKRSLGWARHNNPNVTFMSMAVIETEGGSSIYTAMKHNVNGEICINHTEFHDEAHHELDSNIVRPVEAGNIVTGLDHFEGEIVSILIDGAIHADKLVTAGQITLDEDGDLAIIGFNYSKKFKTLPIDIGSPTGAASGLVKHWNRIFVRLLDSYMPLINGKRPPDRTPSTPLDTPELAVTDDIYVTESGRDRFGQIEIEQELPLSLMVVGIFGEMGQKSL